MPYAPLLAAQAGLLEFIPMVGPAVAGVVFILPGLAVSPQMVLWAVGADTLQQLVESNILQPIVQEKVVFLPPVFGGWRTVTPRRM